MRFTDIFIRRPVLAMVVSIVILLLGLRAATSLTVREFPEIQNAVITVTTPYPGADPGLVQGFVTTPLEREIASAEGIDYLVSTSAQNASTIQAYLRIETEADEALTQIASKVNKLRGEMPEGSEDPVVDLQTGSGTAAAYISFRSDLLSSSQITDYLVRVVQPKLSAIPGMQRAEIFGEGEFAMRIWLKADRLAALGVTPSEVLAALRNNSFLAAVGEAKSNYIKVPMTARTDLRSAEEFRQLVVRAEGGAIVRLGDVANVVLGATTYDRAFKLSGQQATFIGINPAPDANVIDVITRLRELWPDILSQLPEGMDASIDYDSTVYIKDAIREVEKTLIEAIVIVIVVIFLFLGSMRSVVIPAVTVPLSLIGSLFLMLLMGFSINLLTLLSMVLAIGMVVDDAIIVLENVHRHIEEGATPLDASIQGARELLGPVVAMTLTLVAVYLPIGFLGGLTGKLFIEFAFSLAAAVLLSGIIALTLTPMMCSKLLRPHGVDQGRLARWLDARFDALRLGYRRRLSGALESRNALLVFGAIVLVSCYFLFRSAPSELAPVEDTGFFGTLIEADPTTSIEGLAAYSDEVARRLRTPPEVDFTFELNGAFSSNSTFTGTVLLPWSQRERTTQQVVDSLQGAISTAAGVSVASFVPPALPTAGQGLPVEFIVSSTQSQQVIDGVVKQIIGEAMASKKFIFVNSDLKIDLPQTEILVDRDKAALLGIEMRSLGSDLSALLSGAYIGRFSLEDRSYRVIPQVGRPQRLSPQDITDYYTRTADGRLIPLSTLVSFKDSVQPQNLKRFQQLNAATIQGVQRPGVSLGDALATLEAAAAKHMPRGFQVDYAGQSRQYKAEGSALVATFAFALIMIFLVLAAQFESFRDPLIMLITVPMSICGALFFVNLLGMFQVPGASLNIYTQVGLVTLIGVISKHGILIVEFANKLQERGMSRLEAIVDAASIRLRPVLMTTAALVIAMLPLLVASGPGASSRFSMGLVIVGGMAVGTAFTLFVVPAMYLLLGRRHAAAPAAVPARA